MQYCGALEERGSKAQHRKLQQRKKKRDKAIHSRVPDSST